MPGKIPATMTSWPIAPAIADFMNYDLWHLHQGLDIGLLWHSSRCPWVNDMARSTYVHYILWLHWPPSGVTGTLFEDGAKYNLPKVSGDNALSQWCASPSAAIGAAAIDNAIDIFLCCHVIYLLLSSWEGGDSVGGKGVCGAEPQ